MTNWHEKRAEPRTAVTHDSWQVLHAERDTPLGVLANLSSSGLMLNTAEPLPERTTYQARLCWLDANGARHSLPLGLHVLWCNEGPGGGHWTGCEIIAISDADQLILDRLLDRSLGN